jgi:hypothetical protein
LRARRICTSPFVGRQYDDLRIWKFSSNRDDGIESVHLRHLQIHERDVWTMGTELLDRLAAVRGLGDQSHIRLGADEYGYALPYEGVVVNRQNSNLS